MCYNINTSLMLFLPNELFFQSLPSPPAAPLRSSISQIRNWLGMKLRYDYVWVVHSSAHSFESLFSCWGDRGIYSQHIWIWAWASNVQDMRVWCWFCTKQKHILQQHCILPLIEYMFCFSYYVNIRSPGNNDDNTNLLFVHLTQHYSLCLYRLPKQYAMRGICSSSCSRCGWNPEDRGVEEVLL